MKKFLAGWNLALLLAALAMPVWAGPAEDEEIKAKLEEQYQDSKEIHGRYVERYYWDESAEVQVLVADGVVTLRGIVQDSEAKGAYLRIARETSGVINVVDKIRVIPSERKVD